MSRIVVKNLPKHITGERLRNVFQSKGQITDLQLKYTKDGKFRQFAFVGYKTEEEAVAAREYFHNTYLDTSKIQVEMWSALGDASKPRAWSKYSKDSLAYAKKSENAKTRQMEHEKSKAHETERSPVKKTKANNDELLNDPKYLEFLEVTKKSSQRPVWSNDAIGAVTESDIYSRQEKELSKKSKIPLTEETREKETVSESPKGTKKKKKGKEKEGTNTKKLSDMDFLKTKVVKSLESDDDVDDKKELERAEDSCKEETKDLKMESKPRSEFDDKFTVKLRGLPYACSKKDVRRFLLPLRPLSLRVPMKVKGIAYAKFKTEKELKQALNKHRGFINGHRIGIVKYIPKAKVNEEEAAGAKWNKDVNNEPHCETVGESGRIFVRNLSYTVTEEELEKLFSKYGPVTEVHLPVDRISRNIKGFAFVTYMLPEHATKALSELDGTSFQGRILHLIPAKLKEAIMVEIPEEIAFKRKKEVKQKALSGSSHNWNMLFLGPNAIADTMVEKYNISKAKLLDAETKDSVAVRMALGETQLVSETREFLLKHNIELDAFGQPAAERSKTVILVKNLPAKTRADEIQELFEKYGEVSRVILPPSGVTAIVEFQAPSEARAAFKKLAYSKFYHMPLYLEWAPVNIFKPKEEKADVGDDTNVSKPEDVNSEEDEEEEPEPETTLFVKNLNFETMEESLRKVFERCGTVHSVTIARKKDAKNPGKLLSMGYGFVQYKKKAMAQTALKELQHVMLDDHSLELKMSQRATVPSLSGRKTAKATKQKTTKILVRNLPFEAKLNEVKQLFSVFGELRAVRLPKKLDGSSRGFAFVDFLSKNDAKRAFKSLCNSTHFYGRRLNLEWANTEDDNVELLQQKTRRYFNEGPKAKRLKSQDLLSSLDSALNETD